MDVRSSSSSPDPLGHPGDPEFLLSSARKPFLRPSSQRVSLSPLKVQTPRRGRPPLHNRDSSPRKSNKKSAQSIRYEDIILPSTPPPWSGDGKGKANGVSSARFDRRSLSPTKTTLQSDGNISPWRIRVTVEAERNEDEENLDKGGNSNVAKTGLGTWVNGDKMTTTTTTKVPLKGGTSSVEQTPKKRRKRKGKSDIANRPPTPRRRRSDAMEKKLDSVEVKRRKIGTQKSPQSTNNEETSANQENNISSHLEDTINNRSDPFLDIAMDGAAGDMESDIMATETENVEDDLQLVPINASQSNISYPNIVMSDTGRIPLDRRKSPTPAEIFSSPQRRGGLSPMNTIDAGHTPRPKRMYPTPTSSSVQEEEVLEKSLQQTYSPRKSKVEPKTYKRKDPTEEHREFDSIVESEGFSMVSLDSLPSTKQRLRQLIQNRNQEPRLSNDGGTSQSFQEASNNPKVMDSTSATNNHPRTHLNEVTFTSSEQPAARDPSSSPQQKMKTPFAKIISPQAPPAAPAPPAMSTARRPLARLARVVRAGIALQGLLGHRRKTGVLQSPFSSPNTHPTDDIEATRQRLDYLFQDFSSETQRELRAGLRFGEELVKRLRLLDRQQREWPSLEKSNNRSPEAPAVEANSSTGPGFPTDEHYGDTSAETVDSLMLRREAEWQREREATSRQIQTANASQVIVIDSEEESRQYPNEEIDNDYDNNDDKEMEENTTDTEELNYREDTDIWQQEAREHQPQNQSPSFTDIIHEDLPKLRGLKTSSPLRRLEEVGNSMDEDDDDDEMVPLPELSARREGFPILSVGRTKMAQYRDSNASISSLLGTPDSATRRFYENNYGSSHEPFSHPESARTMRAQALGHRQQQNPRGRQSPVVPDSEEWRETNIFRDRYHQDHYTDDDYNYDGLPEGYGPLSSPEGIRTLPSPEGIRTPKQSSLHDVEIGEEEEKDEVISVGGSEFSSPSIPEPPEQTSTTTWFNKLASTLAPAWLTSTPAPTSKRAANTKPEPDQQEQKKKEKKEKKKKKNDKRDRRIKRSRPRTKKPLALSGYFTDDHYVALRRIYREAKARPDDFIYHPTPEFEALNGKWIWGGEYRRKPTEVQLAIVERYRDKLINDDIRAGGSGKMGWSERDILKRLLSIIVGEKIRREAKKRQEQMHAVSLSNT